jgi:hypothetical protein
MATQANTFEDFGTVGAGYSAPRAVTTEPNRVRSLPNEDIFFYRKPIDNSRVVKQANPAARARDRRYLAAIMAGTLVAGAFVWPVMDSISTGYQISELKQQQERLIAESTALEVEEARLLSPERLQLLAPQMQFADPEPGQVVFLNPTPDGSLAYNSPSK